MSYIPELLETNFTGLSINDFIVNMNHIADKLEGHPAFQGELPEYVTKSARLRQLADELGKARDAAAGGDRDRTSEKKALLAKGQLILSMNAYHLVMLSLVRNDPSMLADGGYELKPKNGSKSPKNLLTVSPDPSLKHGGMSGAITVHVSRVHSKAAIELQTTTQDPNAEESWNTPGMMFLKSRMELNRLEPGKRLYVRARYHQNGAAGPWSSPANIIVI